MRSTLILLSLAAVALFVRTWRRTRPRPSARRRPTGARSSRVVRRGEARKSALQAGRALPPRTVVQQAQLEPREPPLRPAPPPPRRRRLAAAARPMGRGTTSPGRPRRPRRGCARDSDAVRAARRGPPLRRVQAGLCGIMARCSSACCAPRLARRRRDGAPALLLARDLRARARRRRLEGGGGGRRGFCRHVFERLCAHVPLPGAGAVRGGGAIVAGAPVRQLAAGERERRVGRRAAAATADIALVAPVRAAASDDDKAPSRHARRVAQLAAAVDRHPCCAAGLLELAPTGRPRRGETARRTPAGWSGGTRGRATPARRGAYVVDIESLLLGHDAHADGDECVAYGDWHVAGPRSTAAICAGARSVLQVQGAPAVRGEPAVPAVRAGLDGRPPPRRRAVAALGPPRAHCGAGGPPLGV